VPRQLRAVEHLHGARRHVPGGVHHKCKPGADAGGEGGGAA
jgi:hypothetical protein